MAPALVAEDLLRHEGFDDVQYITGADLTASEQALAVGDADLNLSYALRVVNRLDAGDPIVVLAGVHLGCIEFFASDRVRSVRDLSGKRIAVGRMAIALPQFVKVVLGQIGLAVPNDVEMVQRASPEAIALFVEGKVDGFMGIPPEPQELRARKVGHVLIDTARDRPWSQYFCCVVSVNRSFLRRHPVAAKRAVRAILKAADLCSSDPDGAARLLVDRGHTPRLDHARDTLQRVSYRAWRDFAPEDALRFYALRLHEAGGLKTSPNKLILDGTDWRILTELRKELKG